MQGGLPTKAMARGDAQTATPRSGGLLLRAVSWKLPSPARPPLSATLSSAHTKLVAKMARVPRLHKARGQDDGPCHGSAELVARTTARVTTPPRSLPTTCYLIPTT